MPFKFRWTAAVWLLSLVLCGAQEISFWQQSTNAAQIALQDRSGVPPGIGWEAFGNAQVEPSEPLADPPALFGASSLPALCSRRNVPIPADATICSARVRSLPDIRAPPFPGFSV